MSWLFALEQYTQSSFALNNDAPLNPPSTKSSALAPRDVNTLKPLRTIKKKSDYKQKMKKRGKLDTLRKKIEETKEFVGSLLQPQATVPTGCHSIQNQEVSSVAWYDGTHGFPLPDFDEANSNSVLSPLTSEQQQLPLPITPIERNKPLGIKSPTRPRTPGSGILSPSNNKVKRQFHSPTFRDLFASSKDQSPDFFLQEQSSFALLDEECGYDSDDYFDEDERFPSWSRLPVTEADLKHSNKSTYDGFYTARSVQDLSSTQVLKGHCSSEFDRVLESGEAEYASIGSFQIGKPIGAGKFGTIYLARSRKHNQLFVAVKVMFKSCLTQGHITQLLREIKHLDTLRNKNIISLYDFFHDEERIYLVMEYANGGDLYHTLSARQHFSEPDAASVFKQALEAIKTCHDNGIVHRDIKPENFVWGAGHTLKLIDFGWSAPCDVGERRRTLCGTLDYLPPEMVTNKPYGQMADTWCLGVLLFELLTGSPPFEDEDFLVTKLNIKYVSYNVPDFISQQAKHLLRDILKADPLARPTIEQLLSHPWIISNTQNGESK